MKSGMAPTLGATTMAKPTNIAAFKYKGVFEDSQGIERDRYENRVSLPTDDCPGSDQEMIVRIDTNPSDANDTLVTVLIISGDNVRILLQGEAESLNAAACALYGAARTKTVNVFEPVTKGTRS